MELINERMQVKRALKNWPDRYLAISKQELAIKKEKLSELDPETATAEDIAAIVGNTHLVHKSECCECGEDSWNIVKLGQDIEYDDPVAWICRDCLVKAIKLIDGG